MTRPLKIAVIAGEESGEQLAADLLLALKATTGRQIELVGVGGRRLADLGLKSLFPSQDIALMGFSAVVRDLPRLIARIGSTAKAIVAGRPDCLITIDSPEFTLRVAKKVRAVAPAIPIVHYVCPSVWAWRPGRAKEMKPYIDHVLCLLPFEPTELRQLGGPEGSFVGHRLTADPNIVAAREMQAKPRHVSPDRETTLLLLPGSRRGEVGALMKPFGETVELLRQRGHRLKLVLPTVPHVADQVRALSADWAQQPEIITEPDDKWRAFGSADAALCASGTVSLELALADVPLVSCYKLDGLARFAKGLVSTWTIVLPNLIADRPIVHEFIDFMVRPSYLARQLEALIGDTALRRWQKDGFSEVRRRMATKQSAGNLAADIVLEILDKKNGEQPLAR